MDQRMELLNCCQFLSIKEIFQLHFSSFQYGFNSFYQDDDFKGGAHPDIYCERGDITATMGTTTTTGEEELEDTTPMKIKQEDGQFSFNEIYTYLSAGSYSTSFTKADKQALRKFFVVRNTQLYYIGGVRVLHAIIQLYLYYSTM